MIHLCLNVTSASKLLFAMLYHLTYKELFFLFELKMFCSQDIEICVFDEFPNFNICDVIINITAHYPSRHLLAQS